MSEQLAFDCGERWVLESDVLDDPIDDVPLLRNPRPVTTRARRTRWRPINNLPPLDTYEETQP